VKDAEPLLVTAWLRDPIILDRNQPLDGILAATIIETPELREKDRHYRHFRRNVGKYGEASARAYWASKGWELPAHPYFIPLKVWGMGHGHGLWVYCSSWATVQGESGVTYFNSHFDIELAERFHLRGKVSTGKGELKSEHIPLQYTVTEKLSWYVLGWKEEIEKILSVTYALAKKRNRGYGGVRKWTVESVEEDMSVIAPDGQIMRPIPLTLLEKMNLRGNFQLAWTTYRPPYWDGRYVARCAVGGKVDRMNGS